MLVKFEDENGKIILEGKTLFIPNVGDMIVNATNYYRVTNRAIYYEEDIIIIEIEEE